MNHLIVMIALAQGTSLPSTTVREAWIASPSNYGQASLDPIAIDRWNSLLLNKVVDPATPSFGIDADALNQIRLGFRDPLAATPKSRSCEVFDGCGEQVNRWVSIPSLAAAAVFLWFLSLLGRSVFRRSALRRD